MPDAPKPSAVDIAMRAAMIERTIGPTRPFGVWDTAGCPKCGFDEPFVKRYCLGNQPLDPNAKCRHEGEHLHVCCPRCLVSWSEKVRDADV